MDIDRRQFLTYGAAGAASLFVGSHIPWLGAKEAAAATRTLDLTITDTIKEMVTYNAINRNAECYFWTYKSNTPSLPVDCPGPTVYVTAGDTINLRIKNDLDEPHAFFIPGIYDKCPPIQPGDVFNDSFTIPLNQAGTHLYFDNLNAPVNRVMGLHGALVVMPAGPSGAKWTPYSAAQVTPKIQMLFNDLGTSSHWPGLAWEQGDPLTLTPPFRQYIWLCHQASPLLFKAVGSFPAGLDFSATEFVTRFRADTFSRNNHNQNVASDLPQFFTGGGQSGHFMHNNPVMIPMARVGEPVVLRVLNAGLQTHSMHFHGEHFYVIAVDGIVQGATNPREAGTKSPGPIWVDTFTANPIGYASFKYDVLFPFMRPPDVPNTRGIGRGGSGDQALPTLAGGLTWPPLEEFNVTVVDEDRPTALNTVRQSPLVYPAHDHTEATQTAQGGNYNCGVIGGINIIGDRNVPLDPAFINNDRNRPLPPMTFPMDDDFATMIGLNEPQPLLVYGIDEVRTNGTGIMEPSKDQRLSSIKPRANFPPILP